MIRDLKSIYFPAFYLLCTAVIYFFFSEIKFQWMKIKQPF